MERIEEVYNDIDILSQRDENGVVYLYIANGSKDLRFRMVDGKDFTSPKQAIQYAKGLIDLTKRLRDAESQ